MDVAYTCRTQLHFSDPRAYAQIYHSARKFTKDPYFYASFGQDESSFGFRDPHKAKIRKDIMSPLFSRRAILKLESVVQDKVHYTFFYLLLPVIWHLDLMSDRYPVSPTHIIQRRTSQFILRLPVHDSGHHK